MGQDGPESLETKLNHSRSNGRSGKGKPRAGGDKKIQGPHIHQRRVCPGLVPNDSGCGGMSILFYFVPKNGTDASLKPLGNTPQSKAGIVGRSMRSLALVAIWVVTAVHQYRQDGFCTIDH